jgi:hypothetical protein
MEETSVEKGAEDEFGYFDRAVLWIIKLWSAHMYSIIAFIIITCAVLLFLIFRSRPGNYYDYCAVCPKLADFTPDMCEDWFDEHRADLLAINEPVVLYDAHNARDTRDAPMVCTDKYPEILQQCLAVPNLWRAFIIKVARRTEQKEHRCCAEWANNTLRCVIPIYVPQGNQTAVVVDQEIKFIKMNKPIVFDSSHPNRIFNNQKRRDAVLLILDIQRPANLPCGTSTVEHGPIIGPFEAQPDKAAAK